MRILEKMRFEYNYNNAKKDEGMKIESRSAE